MRPIDGKSLLVAGVAGGVLVGLLIRLFDTANPNNANSGLYAFFGFLAGIGVQVALRTTGVS